MGRNEQQYHPWLSLLPAEQLLLHCDQHWPFWRLFLWYSHYNALAFGKHTQALTVPHTSVSQNNFPKFFCYLGCPTYSPKCFSQHCGVLHQGPSYSTWGSPHVDHTFGLLTVVSQLTIPSLIPFAVKVSRIHHSWIQALLSWKPNMSWHCRKCIFSTLETFVQPWKRVTSSLSQPLC